MHFSLYINSSWRRDIYCIHEVYEMNLREMKQALAYCKTSGDTLMFVPVKTVESIVQMASSIDNYLTRKKHYAQSESDGSLMMYAQARDLLEMTLKNLEQPEK